MLAVLLVATAATYLWHLSASGYGNEYYAAAAQAGARSWSAWFFGSLDAGNFITVDKPPGALWVTGLSVRIFGMHPLAVLVPQALMGVAAVAVLYATMRRTFDDPVEGAAAGLLAGLALALTPAAAMMFRFDDPDALLVLLSTVAAYGTVRAVRETSWRWMAAVGAVVGLAFLVKMLQALLVVPGLAAAYLTCAATSVRTRVAHVAGAGVALVIAAGWWVAVVALVPAGSRPYVGGSVDDSVLGLAFGYNGASRILGSESSAATATSRAVGVTRLFSGEMGIEISWLLPVAVVALAIGGCSAARGRLARVERAALISWAGWLLVGGGVLSVMRGTEHPYYAVVLAPAVAALVGLGAVWAWRLRAGWDGRVAMAAMVLAGAGWSSLLLHRNGFGVAPTVLATGVLAAALLVVGRRMLWPGALIGVGSVLAGTVVVTLATVASPHHGSIPTAMELPHRGTSGPWTGDEATNPDLARLLAATGTRWSAATNGAESAALLEISSGTSVMAVGGWGGDPAPTLAQFVDDVRAGRVAYWVEAGRGGAARPHGKVIRSASTSAAHTREIAEWVAATYPATTIGDSLVYRLS